MKKTETKTAQKTTQTPDPILAGRQWTMEVDHAQLRASETNPRKEFDEEALKELADSFKANGQLQAILVRPCPKWVAKELAKLKTQAGQGKLKNLGPQKVALELISGEFRPERMLTVNELEAVNGVIKSWAPTFEIVAGERRWRAAGPKYAKLKKVLVTIRLLTDDQVVEAQYVENLQRRDLTPLEEAEGFAVLIRSGKYTAETLAEKLGKSRTMIFDRVKLVNLEGPARDALKEGKISATLASAIATVPGKENQKRVLEEIALDYDDQPRPVADVLQEIEEEFMRPLKGCGWELNDFFAYPGAASPHCNNCPKMTRNMTDENPNLAKGPARCMDVACFEKREQAAAEKIKAQYAKEGKEFWDQSASSNRRHRPEYVWEGDSHHDGKSSQRIEKLAKDVPAPIIAHTHDGLKKVWRRIDLEKAGILKVAPGKTLVEKKAARKEEILDEKVFEEVKILVVPEIVHAVAPGQIELGLPKPVDALLREYVVECMMNWFDRDEGDVESVDQVTAQLIVKKLANAIVREWHSIEEPPRCFKVLGIDVKKLEAQARAKLAPKGARAETPKNGELGTFLDKVAARNVAAPMPATIEKLSREVRSTGLPQNPA